MEDSRWQAQIELCDFTLPTGQENLACDEALLDWCEAGGAGGVLRFWEPQVYFVVLGYANRVATEANTAFCQRRGIPILRRSSGGGTVLQGPGCLNYSLILPIGDTGPLLSIPGTNEFVMRRHQEVLRSVVRRPVEVQGHTDLAIGGLKFSGNAQRRRQRFLLFHGCFLLEMDIGLIEQALPRPSKEPEYRAQRSHAAFLMNLAVPAQTLKAALRAAWRAGGTLPVPPAERIATLVKEKYGQREWNFKF